MVGKDRQGDHNDDARPAKEKANLGTEHFFFGVARTVADAAAAAVAAAPTNITCARGDSKVTHIAEKKRQT